MTRVVVLLVLLAGCAAEPLPAQYEIAADALVRWEQRFGDAPRCWHDIELIDWRTLEQSELQNACDDHVGQLDGCEVGGGARVLLAVDAAIVDPAALAHVQQHELRHLLLACSGRVPGGDPDHTDPWWRADHLL